MQAEKIIGLMNEQIPFDNKTLSQLSDVLEEYPYFQAAHILYTLNLQANKDTNTLPEIRKSACYACDRKKFFYLIEKDFIALLLAETENEKDQTLTDTGSFDLIDTFLDKKGQKLGEELLSTQQDIQPALTDYIAYSFSKENMSQKPAVPFENQEIIDTFIAQGETKKARPELKNEEVNREILTPNIEHGESNNFISITLAKIYLKQKKYDRALEIIRKLSLVYPEKSIYFADQIQFLERLVIHKKK
jgi:tetratricopeptide (TPR) repeat protein